MNAIITQNASEPWFSFSMCLPCSFAIRMNHPVTVETINIPYFLTSSGPEWPDDTHWPPSFPPGTPKIWGRSSQTAARWTTAIFNLLLQGERHKLDVSFPSYPFSFVLRDSEDWECPIHAKKWIISLFCFAWLNTGSVDTFPWCEKWQTKI